MLDAGEAADFRPDLAEQLHDHCHPQPVDAREVHARPIGQPLADVVLGASLAGGARQLVDVHLGRAARIQQRVHR
ncbi:hypothetical protein ABIC63_002815 [Pseudacidovorax sp. 1753]